MKLPMSKARRATLALATLLVAVLAFLYVQSRAQGDQRYPEDMAALRHFHQLDATWELEVLKARAGISRDYDPLTDAMSQTGHLLDAFESEVAAQVRLAALIAPELKLLRAAVEHKAALVERFKSNNAVVRNSLDFLPTAAADLQQALAATTQTPTLRRVAAEADALLLDSMLHSQSPNAERSQALAAGLSRLKVDAQALPPVQRDLASIFMAHAGTVLREHENVAQLVNGIVDDSVATRIDAIGNVLTFEQARASGVAATYWQYMFLFAAGLIGMVVVGAVRLARSHKLINSANKALHDANANLEQAVEARTAELSQAQTGLLELNTTLESRVVERTRELEVAMHKAEAASRAKSDFLAAMSHEIRTPMNGVLGMSQVLQQSGLKGRQAEIANVINESALALLGIVDEVLDFSKIEAGQLAVESVPMDLAAAVGGACDTVRHLAMKRAIELTMFIDPRLPAQLMGDGVRLRQVVLNLVGNALKFTSNDPRPGRVSVRAAMAACDDNGANVEISVADNGIGMSAETQSRLFSSFMQADMTTTRRFGGTGLGLSICKRLVDMMGGTIDVQSTLGEGSVMTVRLHLDAAPAEAIEGVGAQVMPVGLQANEPPCAGLDCIVAGDAQGLGEDLRTYLMHAGASPRALVPLANLQQALFGLEPGPWIVIIDKGSEAMLDELRMVCPDAPECRVRFVLVGRNPTGGARVLGADAVMLDGNVLHCDKFVEAVTWAARTELMGSMSEPAPDTLPAPLRATTEALDTESLILVAEDNPINQDVMRMQLEICGRTADMSDDGQQALERWRRGDYRLVLTDLHMPEMDGYELGAAIRREEAATGRRRTPIIAVTANAVRGEATRCRELGMDGYVTKPVQLSALKAMLGQWLGPAPALAQAAGAVVPEVALDVVPDVVPDVVLEATPAAAQSSEPSAVATLDLDVLRALVGTDPEAIHDLLMSFRASAQRSTQEMTAAWRTGASAGVGAAAHKLKSAARAVGALPLGDLCAQIERASETGPADALAPLVAKFETEMRAVDAVLQAA